MVTINEEEFYKVCDKVEGVRGTDFPYEYIPTIEELKCLRIEEHIEEHLEYLLYLSNDPFHTAKSSELAKYIKKLLRDNMTISE